MSTLTIRKVAGALGAEISGVDLGAGLSDEVIAEIRQAFVEHQVVFFRDILPRYPFQGEGEYLVVGGDYRVDVSFL